MYSRISVQHVPIWGYGPFVIADLISHQHPYCTFCFAKRESTSTAIMRVLGFEDLTFTFAQLRDRDRHTDMMIIA